MKATNRPGPRFVMMVDVVPRSESAEIRIELVQRTDGRYFVSSALWERDGSSWAMVEPRLRFALRPAELRRFAAALCLAEAEIARLQGKQP